MLLTSFSDADEEINGVTNIGVLDRIEGIPSMDFFPLPYE